MLATAVRKGAKAFYFSSGIHYIHGVLVDDPSPSKSESTTPKYLALVSDLVPFDSTSLSPFLLLASTFYPVVADQFADKLGEAAVSKLATLVEEQEDSDSYTSESTTSQAGPVGSLKSNGRGSLARVVSGSQMNVTASVCLSRVHHLDRRTKL